VPKPSLREALLEAGGNHLHATGYSATGVAVVAAAAGAPKGSFYNHFRSKDELAVEVLARYSQTRGLELLSEPDIPAMDCIRNHLAHLGSDLAAHGYRRGCMFGNFAAEAPVDAPALTAAVAAALERWRTLLTQTIRRGQGSGEIATDIDAEATAGFIIDAWEGAALRAKTLGDSTPIDNVIEFIFTKIFA
jgi:TetR/AcrR family transcriptional regulator, transcriptional repressor for nem operon